MQVPHGFRFNPTDEELIEVLDRKVSGQEMPLHFIVEAKVYQLEPQDLEWKHSKEVRNEERYYYCKREVNESREVMGRGWWKATSHVKKLVCAAAASSSNNILVGYKRPLTFHRFKHNNDRNRSNAIKTNWIMHEYSLQSTTTEWRLCKMKYKGKASIQEEMERIKKTYSLNNNDHFEAAGGSNHANSGQESTDDHRQNLDDGSYDDVVVHDHEQLLFDEGILILCDEQQQQQQQYKYCHNYQQQPYNNPNSNAWNANYGTDHCFHGQQEQFILDHINDEQALPSLWSWQN